MTIDPNLLSISLHVRELDRQLDEIHRFQQFALNKPRRRPLTARSAEDWKAKLVNFFFTTQPVN